MAELTSNENISTGEENKMKVTDSTEDQTPKQDNSLHKEVSNDELRVCSSSNPFRSTSANPFAIDSNKLGKSILKPSLLSFNSSTISNNSPLKQTTFNPFIKSTEDNLTNSSDKKQSNGDVVKFVPLVKSDPQIPKPVVDHPTLSNEVTSSSTKPTTSFVFGQNLQERVLSDSKSSEPLPSTSSINSNGNSSDTADLLFSFAAKSDSSKTETFKEKESKSLTESAKEYEESRANKRKYEEVQVKTGEEDETNILSVSCKLFAFDKACSNWQERGRGTLRLNDYEMDDNQVGSRLVFRTSGSLRVILNTKIWAEMTIDKANEKSIRLTALDSNGEIKVFLIVSSIEDSRQLFSHLQSRLEKEIASQKRKKLMAEKPVEK